MYLIYNFHVIWLPARSPFDIWINGSELKKICRLKGEKTGVNLNTSIR